MTVPLTTVIGAGAWGTALALVLARNAQPTWLWGRDSTLITTMKRQRCNQRYLPDIPLPDNLQVTMELAPALAQSDLVLIAVPSAAFQSVLPHLNAKLPLQGVIWATKGLDPTSGQFLHEVFQKQFGDTLPFAILSGPSFAHEVAKNLPTAVNLASTTASLIHFALPRFHSNTFRLYPTTDYLGVQIAGAVKNVLAIAAGINDGMKLGTNSRSALITRGLAEMWRLGQALNCQMATFMGLAGLGDVVLTCSDDQSRNRGFGLAIGRGLSPEQAKQASGKTIEGVAAAREIKNLATLHHIEMPICEQVYQVIYHGLSPKIAVEYLMAREPRYDPLMP